MLGTTSWQFLWMLFDKNLSCELRQIVSGLLVPGASCTGAEAGMVNWVKVYLSPHKKLTLLKSVSILPSNVLGSENEKSESSMYSVAFTAS